MKKVVIAAAATLAVAAETVSAGMPSRGHDATVRNVNEQQKAKREKTGIEKRLEKESIAEEWQREGEEYLPLADGGRLARGPSDSLIILAERLGLSQEQQNRIRQILNRKVLLIRAVARDTALNARQQREKAAAILEEEYGRISKLLTEQQRKGFDELRSRTGDAGRR